MHKTQPDSQIATVSANDFLRFYKCDSWVDYISQRGYFQDDDIWNFLHTHGLVVSLLDGDFTSGEAERITEEINDQIRSTRYEIDETESQA
jgi:hypothetical protein